MQNTNNVNKWMGFVGQIGIPGSMLFLVSIGLYFLADDYLSAQTATLKDVASTITRINVLVESDKAERKAEAISELNKKFERHDIKVSESFDRQTRILEKLSDIVEDMNKKQ